DLARRPHFLPDRPAEPASRTHPLGLQLRNPRARRKADYRRSDSNRGGGRKEDTRPALRATGATVVSRCRDAPGRRDAGRKDSACKRSALSSVGWSSDRPERVQVGDEAHPTLKEDPNGVPGRRSHTAAGHRAGNGFRVEPEKGRGRVAADNETAGTSLCGLRLRRRCRAPAQTLPDVRRSGLATHPSRVGVCRCRVRTLMSSAPTAHLVEIRGGLIPAPGRPSVDPEETIAWEQISPREIRAEDWSRFEDSIAEIFTAFGLEPNTASTRTTPLRFLKALYDATAGYEGDAKLLTAFPTEYHHEAAAQISQVIEGPISFYSLCEHHALPFHGFAHVGYVAHEQIIGISKLTRLV